MAWCSLTGLTDVQSLRHRWLDAVWVDDAEPLRLAISDPAAAARDVRMVCRASDEANVIRWTRWSWPERGVDGGRVITVVDIDGDKSRERELHDRATRDPLTGLANRSQFVATLERRISDLDGDGADSVVLIYLDLDRFKEVNDAGGHDVGDEVLTRVAQRLMAATRPDDLVGRLGGDEFGVICAGLPSEADTSLLLGRLVAAFDTPFDVGGRTWPVRAALGYAIATEPRCDPEGLVNVADARMYAAKRRGRTALSGPTTPAERLGEPEPADMVTEQARQALVEAAEVLHRLWSAAIGGELDAAACVGLGDAARQVRAALLLLGPQVIV